MISGKKKNTDNVKLYIFYCLCCCPFWSIVSLIIVNIDSVVQITKKTFVKRAKIEFDKTRKTRLSLPSLSHRLHALNMVSLVTIASPIGISLLSVKIGNGQLMIQCHFSGPSCLEL